MSQFVQFCTYLKKTFLMNFIWTLKIRCFLATKMQHLTKSLTSNGLKIKHINFPLHLNQRKRYSKDFFFERLLLKTLWFGGKPKSLVLKFFGLMVIEICYNKKQFWILYRKLGTLDDHTTRDERFHNVWWQCREQNM